MSVDDNWLCPLHPFGHQWTDTLRCELCGAVRSAADAIVSVLGSARGWDRTDAERVRDAHRAEVLAEAIEAARAEHLKEDTGTSEDEAYNQGVDDAVAAIGALLETASSSRTAADEQPEFAVRWPDGELTRAADREHGLRAIEIARRVEPGAVLVQRSCTAWREATS